MPKVGGALEITFPFEFAVHGTAVSSQASAPSRDAWKVRIRAACGSFLPASHFLTEAPVSVTLYYFPDGEMVGDLDNIIKPVLDAMAQQVYVDDMQVERLVAQKFEPHRSPKFNNPSGILGASIVGERPVLHVRVATAGFAEIVE